WGTAPFQKLYEPNPGSLSSLPLMPEWCFVLFSLAVLAALGVFWPPLGWALVPLAAGLLISLVQAVRAAAAASFPSKGPGRTRRLTLKLVVAMLHLVQPIARLAGRIQHGLGPWRWRDFVPVFPRSTRQSLWSEAWQAPEARLAEIEQILRPSGAVVIAAGDFRALGLARPRRALWIDPLHRRHRGAWRRQAAFPPVGLAEGPRPLAGGDARTRCPRLHGGGGWRLDHCHHAERGIGHDRGPRLCGLCHCDEGLAGCDQ